PEKILKTLLSVEEKILKDPKTIEENIKFYFKLPNYSKELLTHEKMDVDLSQAKSSLLEAEKALEKIENWDEETIKDSLMEIIEKNGIKNGQLLWPMRAALTGSQFSPGAFEVAVVLGKEESLKRIKTAIEKLGTSMNGKTQSITGKKPANARSVKVHTKIKTSA
ncbi:MAG: hypothetical protein PHP74_04530, partial [Candidatus Gracilibacteria bacterium]|nr:hypothetical protein [Candidatus Gracilibacteria bacterium]